MEAGIQLGLTRVFRRLAALLTLVGCAFIYNFTADTMAPVLTPLCGGLAGFVTTWVMARWLPRHPALAGAASALLMQPLAWALVRGFGLISGGFAEAPDLILRQFAETTFIGLVYGGWLVVVIGALAGWIVARLERMQRPPD